MIYRIEMKVLYGFTYRGLSGPIVHEVQIKYIPCEAHPDELLSFSGAFEDVINQLQVAYGNSRGGFENFEAMSGPTAKLVEPKDLTLSVVTPDKTASGPVKAQSFCQELINQLTDILFIAPPPERPAHLPEFPLDFAGFERNSRA